MKSYVVTVPDQVGLKGLTAMLEDALMARADIPDEEYEATEVRKLKPKITHYQCR